MKIYTYTNKGGRKYNEDNLGCQVKEGRSIFVLADGLGGHRNGAEASDFVVQHLMAALAYPKQITSEEMNLAYRETEKELLQRQKEYGCPGMKTTAVSLVIQDGTAVWGHIGDSRLYYFSQGALVSVTKDHSVSYQKFLAGEIAYKEIPGDEDRSSLLGVFGNSHSFRPQIDTVRKLEAGDAFLMCSDGFWEYVRDVEMLIDQLKSNSPKDWVDYMLLRHIQRVGFGNDNFSLIALFVEDEDII